MNDSRLNVITKVSSFYREAMESRLIYRLLVGKNPINISPFLPAGRTLTGFWSLEIDPIVNLINSHLNASFEMAGGMFFETELIVAITNISNVETLVDYDHLKVHHDEDYDSDEIFVTNFLGDPIKYIPAIAFLDRELYKQKDKLTPDMEVNKEINDVIIEMSNKRSLTEEDRSKIISLINKVNDQYKTRILKEILDANGNYIPEY